MKRYAYGGLLLLLVVLLLGCAVSASAQESTPAPTTTTTTTAAEEPTTTAACSDCHDQAKTFLTNPHARGAVKDGAVSNDTCATCHGDGTEHMQSGGDKTKITVPRGRTGSDETCMLCHDVTTDKMTRRGMHANSNQVNCLTCHSIHSSDPHSPHLVAKPQLALCGTCHTQSASMQAKPYAHRLDRGGMTCSTCHEPHGRRATAERSLALTGHLRRAQSGEAPCVSCHTEKRGPFVFAHGGAELAECTACHETHGSSNPKQLNRATVQQVCLECHSPIATGTLGSQPPSFHNLSLPRYQNCTTCHTAVHGSNRDPQLLK
ncbi:MAG TPA: cytochrome c3 family protein [Thermoanaerobaculia bacterium]|nr:cytochrome c3 family protein [Thermoanaerobaculia bacterium]